MITQLAVRGVSWVIKYGDVPSGPLASHGSRIADGDRQGQLTLHKELLPGGRLELHAQWAIAEISGFIGLLAGRTSKTASLEELTEAAAAGWAAQ